MQNGRHPPNTEWPWSSVLPASQWSRDFVRVFSRPRQVNFHCDARIFTSLYLYISAHIIFLFFCSVRFCFVLFRPALVISFVATTQEMLVHARLAIVTNVWMELVSARRTDAQKFYFRRRVCARRKNNKTKNEWGKEKRTHTKRARNSSTNEQSRVTQTEYDRRRGNSVYLCIFGETARISNFCCAIQFCLRAFFSLSGAVFNSMTRAQCAWVSSFYLLRRNWTEEKRKREWENEQKWTTLADDDDDDDDDTYHMRAMCIYLNLNLNLDRMAKRQRLNAGRLHILCMATARMHSHLIWSGYPDKNTKSCFVFSFFIQLKRVKRVCPLLSLSFPTMRLRSSEIIG